MLKQLFKNKLTWAFLAVSIFMSMFMSFNYLGAFLDPTDNTHNLPIAIVNSDQGVSLGGQNMAYGQQVITQLTATPQQSDVIQWTVLSSRDEAVAGLNNNKYYAVLIIPSNYSASLLALAIPTTSGTHAPAQIDVLTSAAGGSYANSLSQTAAQTTISTISKQTRTVLEQQLTAAGAKLTPQMANVIADPVQANIQPGVNVGTHSARGLSSFYFALMLILSGFVGTNVMGTLIDGAVAERRKQNIAVNKQTIFRLKATFYTAMAVVAGLAVTWVAVGWLGMDTPNVWTLGLLAILVTVTTAELSLLFQVVFGQLGLLVGLIFFTVLGVPASGGAYTFQMLPSFWQAVSHIVPLRYATDGTRALLFLSDNSGDTGLGTAIIVLATYAIAGVSLTWLFSYLYDRYEHRTTAASQREQASEPGLLPG